MEAILENLIEYSKTLGPEGKFLFGVMLLIIFSGLLTFFVQVYKITTKLILGTINGIFGNIYKIFKRAPKNNDTSEGFIRIENTMKQFLKEIEEKKPGDIL